jgi:hypothetical protein
MTFFSRGRKAILPGVPPSRQNEYSFSQWLQTTKNCGAVSDTNPAAEYVIFKNEGHIFGFGKPSRALSASWISSIGSS